MPVRTLHIGSQGDKESLIELCSSLIKKIEQNSNHDILNNIKIRLIHLKMRLIYDNNYTYKFVRRSYELCLELNGILELRETNFDYINDIEQRLDNILGFNMEPILNSVEFYSRQIEKLQSKIDEYMKHESDNNDKILELQSDVKSLEAEKKTVEKQNEAINNWKNKISAAFQGLKGPINKLQQEHDRLNILYKIYGLTSIAIVILLIVIEIIVCHKINSYIIYPTWEEYWTMVLPVPVAIGLLWGFITQMNRAQRQMVVLARQIYEIEYIEGLLQALNTLSVNIEESMSKINDAISRLIDNHLRNMDGMRIDESLLQKLEKLDALPYDKIPDLIKLLNSK